MPGTAHNLYMDWSGVAFTPAGGTAVPITEVVDVEFDEHGSMERFYGDQAKIARAVRMVNYIFTAKISGGNKQAVESIPLNTVGVLVATHNDYLNGSGTGAITYTLANCMISSRSGKGSNNKFGATEVTLEAFSTDGITSPLSSVVAV